MRTKEDHSHAAPGGSATSDVLSKPEVEDGQQLLAAFVACRTTLDDLSERAAALGENVSGAVIASHLTGKCDITDAQHNVVANAINARLGELSLPASAPYRDSQLG